MHLKIYTEARSNITKCKSIKIIIILLNSTSDSHSHVLNIIKSVPPSVSNDSLSIWRKWSIKPGGCVMGWAGSLLQNPPSCFCLMAQHPLQLEFTTFFLFLMKCNIAHLDVHISQPRVHFPVTVPVICPFILNMQTAETLHLLLICVRTQQMQWCIKWTNTSTILLKIYS